MMTCQNFELLNVGLGTEYSVLIRPCWRSKFDRKGKSDKCSNQTKTSSCISMSTNSFRGVPRAAPRTFWILIPRAKIRLIASSPLISLRKIQLSPISSLTTIHPNHHVSSKDHSQLCTRRHRQYPAHPPRQDRRPCKPQMQPLCASCFPSQCTKIYMSTNSLRSNSGQGGIHLGGRLRKG